MNPRRLETVRRSDTTSLLQLPPLLPPLSATGEDITPLHPHQSTLKGAGIAGEGRTPQVTIHPLGGTPVLPQATHRPLPTGVGRHSLGHRPLEHELPFSDHETGACLGTDMSLHLITSLHEVNTQGEVPRPPLLTTVTTPPLLLPDPDPQGGGT